MGDAAVRARRGGRRVSRASRTLTLLLAPVITIAAVLPTAIPAAAQSGDVTFDAVFDDRSLDDVDESDPLRVDPADIIDVELTVRNDTGTDVVISQVRIESKLLSFTFLTQALRTDLVVEAGETTTLTLPADFIGVEDQASGHFRAEMRLVDPDGSTVASRDFTIDIRGDAFAAANVVFYLLILFAVFVLVSNIVAIMRRRLEVNRLVRAARLGVVGLQVGLVLAIASSLFRFRALSGAQWIPLLAIAGVIGFAVGYFLTLAPRDVVEETDAEVSQATLEFEAARRRATGDFDRAAAASGDGSDPEADRLTVDTTPDPEVDRPTVDATPDPATDPRATMTAGEDGDSEAGRVTGGSEPTLSRETVVEPDGGGDAPRGDGEGTR